MLEFEYIEGGLREQTPSFRAPIPFCFWYTKIDASSLFWYTHIVM